MDKQQTHSLRLKFSDILITILISVVFGVIITLWGTMYGVADALLGQAKQLLYGMWFMAGPFAFLIIRKPGVAVLASIASAYVSSLLGSPWGFETFIYGLVQGLAAELIFAAFRYRKFGLVVAGVAGIASAVGSYLVDLVYGYANYEMWALLLKYGLRVISAFIFTGVFAYLLVKAIEATGVTKLIRPVAKEELDELN